MAQYTLTIKQIVESNVELFDFKYPIFEENYRPILNQRIIDHYYFREIGHETVGRFKHFLKNKMELIMPYYNKLYLSDLLEQRILDNYDVTEKYEREIEGTTNTNNTSQYNVTGNNSSLNLESDTPQNRLDITSNDFVSQINKNTDTTTQNQNSENALMSDEKNIEKWIRTMKGNIGVQTDADAIMKYRQTLLKIDQMLIDELNELFMGVY